jgi:hypothetical protein
MQQFDADTYRITLKNYKVTSYRFIALLIVFFNLAIFVYLLFSEKYFYDASACLFLISAYCLYRFYVAKKNQSGFFLDEFSFFILSGCWVALDNYFIACGCIFIALLYHFALQKSAFVIDNSSVKKLNFPKTNFSWDKFSNVLVRDNILTLDFNNNKLIQAEIEDDKNITESEFNEFAQRQIIKYSSAEGKLFLN